MDDAVIALYQNGERLRPSNGYPMRLLLPGYEGNLQVKWLRRIKITEAPTMTRDETSKYRLLLPDGKAFQFGFPVEGAGASRGSKATPHLASSVLLQSREARGALIEDGRAIRLGRIDLVRGRIIAFVKKPPIIGRGRRG